ncbi:MAG: dipeptide ABC transporter ATP-binding protein [Roseicyclus sp.]
MGAVEAVRGISFRIEPGRTLALVGESGSGKSMTALALMGLLPRGAVMRADRIALSGGGLPAEVRGDRVSMIFQEPMTALNPVWTIGDQLMAVHRRHKGAEGARSRALDLLARVAVPDPERRMRQYPHEMSGGQRQRVLIAMALMCAPDILIADEPTTALDVTTQARLLDLLAELQADLGLGMLFISHDLGAVARIAHRVAVMKDGDIVEEGETRALLAQARHPYTRALIDSLPRPGMPRRIAAPPLLEAREITRGYRSGGLFDRRRTEVLKGVSLRLGRGETLGIVGESGCGKSTLARILIGLDRADGGGVTHDGKPLAAIPARERARLIQPVFQDPAGSLNPSWTVARILDLPLRLHTALDRTARRDRIAELLEDVGLPPRVAGARPRALSGGQRQRVAIARALAAEPEVLVCDEPTSALDVSVQAQILALLRRLREERDLSMVFVSHDLAVVEALCDRVVVMDAGRIVEEGPADRIFAAPQHARTRALKAAILTIDKGHAPARAAAGRS